MLAAREVETEIPERLLDEKSVAVAASEHGQVVGLVQFRQQLDLSFKAEFMVPLEGEFATLNDRFLQMAVTRVGNELDGGRFSTLENIVYIR
jgi:hypothetical protein